jgi:hypothetical protein
MFDSITTVSRIFRFVIIQQSERRYANTHRKVDEKPEAFNFEEESQFD